MVPEQGVCAAKYAEDDDACGFVLGEDLRYGDACEAVETTVENCAFADAVLDRPAREADCGQACVFTATNTTVEVDTQTPATCWNIVNPKTNFELQVRAAALPVDASDSRNWRLQLLDFELRTYRFHSAQRDQPTPATVGWTRPTDAPVGPRSGPRTSPGTTAAPATTRCLLMLTTPLAFITMRRC